MKDRLGGIVLILLIVITFILIPIIATIDVAKEKQSSTQCYNASCNCGGTYKFVNAANFGGRAFYYWQCDGCGEAIKTEYLLKGGAENE